MLRSDFSVETVELSGYPIQIFKKQFRALRDMFWESVFAHENKVHLIEGENQLTFRQTGNMVVGLAACLKKELRVRKGDHVGTLMGNCFTTLLPFGRLRNCVTQRLCF